MKKAITMILSLWLTACVQAADWTNFSNFASVTAVQERGSKLWVAGRGGVMVIDTATLQKTYYGKKSGLLPSLMVEDMALAVNGTTWIGTYDLGLVRIDNGQFTHFPFADSTIRLYHLAVDPAGTVWCATTDGLYKNENGIFTQISSSGALSGGWDVKVMPDGKILMAGSQPILYDPVTNASYVQPTTVFAYSDATIEVKDSDSYYFATDHGGIIYVQDTTVTDISDTLVSDHFGPKIEQLKKLADGTLLALRADGKVFAFDGTHWAPYGYSSAAEGAAATYLYQRSSGEVMAGGTYHGGLIKSLTGGNDFSIQKFDIWSDRINAVKAKSDHELWIAGGTQIGLYDINTAAFEHIEELPGVTASGNAGIVYWNGSYIAYGYNQLYQWDGSAWQLMNISGLPFYSILCAATDTSGNLYLGAYDGLYVVRGTNVTHYSASTPVFTNNDLIRAIHFDSGSNTVWIATVHGIVRYTGGTFALVNGANTPAIQGYDYIQSIAQDASGTMWFGTAYGGMITYDGSSYALQMLPGSAGNQTVNGIAFDGSTVYVVDNVYGFWIKENGAWTNYNMRNSDLTAGYLTSATVDGHHNVWLTAWDNGTSNAFGLDVYNKNAIALSVQDIGKTSIIAYPNPASSFVTIPDPSLREGSLVTLTDELGRSYPFTLHAQHIDISTLAAGIYILDAHTAAAPTRILKQ
ncbi:MAG: hypothetical protein JSS76_11015 [Bacteroidetes bacterium]|nr:hypothetical protein [Bacteroidota bacterium]